MTRDLVFDPVGKSIAEAPVKSSVTPISDLACQAVPFYDVFSDPLNVTHLQLLDLSFCISHGVVWTEISLEFIEKVCYSRSLAPNITDLQFLLLLILSLVLTDKMLWLGMPNSILMDLVVFLLFLLSYLINM